MSKPVLYDLFCGAGGAGMGYARAGFRVIGVDNVPQPRYPFEFVLADAMTFPLDGADAVHASPPCQLFIRGGTVNKRGRLDLLTPTRERLHESCAVPWVIENVPGAPMRADVTLCGSMFGLTLRRHRWFEFSAPRSVAVPRCDHSYPVAGVYGNPHGAAGAWPGMLPSTVEQWSRSMAIDWMTGKELAQAIPPAYTELIGRSLIGQLTLGVERAS